MAIDSQARGLAGRAIGSVLDVHPFEALDIWPAFDGGAAGTWDATTYANWISGIESNFAGEIASGSVVKVDRGASSDITKHLYSYTAGSGPTKVLLMAGQHGDEKNGMFAAMRWFEQFLRSGHPVMARLRRALTVVWVPTVNPGSYGSARKNPNDVNLNRNYDFYWDRYSPGSSNNNKGASAFSELETQIVKTIVDEGCRVLIDCHNVGAGETAYTILTSPPSPWVLGKRGLTYGAADLWASVYSGTWAEIDVPTKANPTSYSWHSYYALWSKGWRNAASLIVEMAADALGSTPNTVLSRAAAKAYCGFITTFLLTWMREGQRAPHPYPVVWSASRISPASATSITSGGTLIDTTTATALTFDAITPNPLGLTTQAYIDTLYPSPGGIELYADGYIEGGGTQTTRVDINLTVDGAAVRPTSVEVPSSATRRTTFALSWRISKTSLDASTIPRVGLTFARAGTGDSTKIIRASLFARFTPNDDIWPVPGLN